MEFVQKSFFFICMFVRNLARLLTSLSLLSHTQMQSEITLILYIYIYAGGISHFNGVSNFYCLTSSGQSTG